MGDMGFGIDYSVLEYVAKEIKGLAERTSKSTKEIANLIISVQAETKASVEMTADGIKAVDNGIKYVYGVNGALKGIYESSKASTDMSKAIQRATQEEGVVIKQITESIRAITEQIEHISRAINEHSKGTKLISDAAENIKELSRHIKNATLDQFEGGKRIGRVSEDVHSQAEHISTAITSQKVKSGEIARSVDRIQQTTADLYDSSKDMDMAINALKEAARSLTTEMQRFIL